MAFAERLTDADVGVAFDERHRARLLGLAGEINVGLVDDDEPLEGNVLEHGPDRRERDERPRRVTGRAEEDELDRRVGGDEGRELAGQKRERAFRKRVADESREGGHKRGSGRGQDEKVGREVTARDRDNESSQ